MPLFVLIVAGIVDFGWLFFHRSAVDAAVHSGCREGSLVDPMVGDPMARATTALVEALDSGGLPCNDRCTTTVSETGAIPNRALRCELTLEFDPLFGLITGGRSLRATTQVRFEWQRDDAEFMPGSGG